MESHLEFLIHTLSKEYRIHKQLIGPEPCPSEIWAVEEVDDPALTDGRDHDASALF